MSENLQDHRQFGQDLDLFHFQEEAPGMVFWHPRGLALYRVLEAAVREQCRRQGYEELRTPQILRRAAWEASGHWAHFREGMFRVEDQKCEAAVKPVSCPGHVYVAQHSLRSYREFPLRYCELGVVHRDEPSGTLHGLMRARQFVQDDGHIFCSEEQAPLEVKRFCQAVPHFYSAFGFDAPKVALSTRPAEREGSDAEWDHAEAALSRSLDELGVAYVFQPGAGAFYGPKIEYVLQDRYGRDWQCGTIQFDLVMPKRFDLRYVDASGERRHPVMLHRALYGSLERFLGILLEHYGKSLPAWLAPVQVAVLPVEPEQAAAARQFAERLARVSLRAKVLTDDSLSRRVAGAHALSVPFVAVMGARELREGKVSLRRENSQNSLAANAAVVELENWCAAPNFFQEEEILSSAELSA